VKVPALVNLRVLDSNMQMHAYLMHMHMRHVSSDHVRREELGRVSANSTGAGGSTVYIAARLDLRQE